MTLDADASSTSNTVPHVTSPLPSGGQSVQGTASGANPGPASPANKVPLKGSVSKARKPAQKRKELAQATDARDKRHRFKWEDEQYTAARELLRSALDEVFSIDNVADRKTRESQIAEDVILKFPFPGYSDGDMRLIISNWFKNRHQERKAGKHVAGGGTNTAPARAPKKQNDVSALLKHIKARARGPSRLWASVNKELVDARHKELGGSFGDRNRAIKELFEALDPEEREEWRQKAENAKDERLSNPAACFENQSDFSNILASLLHSFLGFEHDKIGAAIMYIRLGYRNAAGGIERDQFTVNMNEKAVSFTDFDGGPVDGEAERWDRYLKAHMPPNPRRQDGLLEYESSGRPLLPEYDADWNMKQAATTLDAWLRAMWEYCGHSGDLPLFDWEEIKANPSNFLPVSWKGLILDDPTTMPIHVLSPLYVRLQEGQHTDNPFTWRSEPEAMVTNHSASTDLSRRSTPVTPTKRIKNVYTSPARRGVGIEQSAPPLKALPTIFESPASSPMDVEDIIATTDVTPINLDAATVLNTVDATAINKVTPTDLEATTCATTSSRSMVDDMFDSQAATLFADHSAGTHSESEDRLATPGPKPRSHPHKRVQEVLQQEGSEAAEQSGTTEADNDKPSEDAGNEPDKTSSNPSLETAHAEPSQSEMSVDAEPSNETMSATGGQNSQDDGRDAEDAGTTRPRRGGRGRAAAQVVVDDASALGPKAAKQTRKRRREDTDDAAGGADASSTRVTRSRAATATAVRETRTTKSRQASKPAAGSSRARLSGEKIILPKNNFTIQLPVEADTTVEMAAEPADVAMLDVDNVCANTDGASYPMDDGAMSEPEDLSEVGDGESEASASLFEPDDAEEESDEAFSGGEDVVPVQPAKQATRRQPKVRRTDITAARSDAGLAQKRKSVTSSANTDNVEHEPGQTNKKVKVAATPTGLRSGWSTSAKTYQTPESKGKAAATPTKPPSTHRVATGKSAGGSITPATLRPPATPANSSGLSTPRNKKPLDTPISSAVRQTKGLGRTNSVTRLKPTQTLANPNAAPTDLANGENGGLNEYGGLQDEDDSAEAHAIAGPVHANVWKMPGLDSQASSSDLDDVFPEDTMTEVVHVPSGILRVNHRPAGQTLSTRHRWNTSDLDPDIRQRFSHSFIPLTRTTMSTLPPWYCMSVEERQALFDRVFPTANHTIEVNDVVFTLMNNRITEWQGKFAAAALNILSAHFVKAGMAKPEVRATWCSEQLGTNVAAMKAPFLWQTWDNGRKQGCFQGELVLKTFGIVHVPVLQALPKALREAEGHSELRPTGALILAVLAVERALTVWLSGSRVIQPGSPGYFSADNWGDKTVVSHGVAKTSNKVANLFARAEKLSCDRWLAILDTARDHHRRHKAIQDRQAIVIESASDAPMTDSDVEC